MLEGETNLGSFRRFGSSVDHLIQESVSAGMNMINDGGEYDIVYFMVLSHLAIEVALNVALAADPSLDRDELMSEARSLASEISMNFEAVLMDKTNKALALRGL